jgi:hypothetical protein
MHNQASADRFLFVQGTKKGKNIHIEHRIHIPNDNKINKITVKYVYQLFPFQGPPKYAYVGIFGIQIYLSGIPETCSKEKRDSYFLTTGGNVIIVRHFGP